MIQRLEEKNINTDGKDVIIANLHSFIRKIESDGYELLKRLRQGDIVFQIGRAEIEDCKAKQFQGRVRQGFHAEQS